MSRLRTTFIVAVTLAAVVLLTPRPVAAQDGCGLLGMIVGCTYERDTQEAQRQQALQQAQIAAQATAVALQAQQQGQQLEYQRWLASEQAQQELARIAARERVDMAQIQAQLEQMHVQERINSINATTTFNVATLQSDAMIAVSRARADEARAQQVTAALVALAVLVVAGALVYAARQYRHAAEVQAQPHLLLTDPWQRRAVLLLEQKRVPWLVRDQRLLAQINGQWVIVEED